MGANSGALGSILKITSLGGLDVGQKWLFKGAPDSPQVPASPPKPIPLDPDAASLARARRVASQRQAGRDSLVVSPQGTPTTGDSGLSLPPANY